ncbi:MAG: FAD-binding protein [Coriobacteriales bacterium]|jgi:fumarate reductase flavoprotein subunit|nr:FAD-binding protein [Coriobacteriales bacterium]
MSELSRRNFLKGAGIGAGALVIGASGAGALAGCSPQSANEPAATGSSGEAATTGTDASQPSYMNRPAVGEPEETVQADFIVCGAGGCGMAALLQADDLGLNTILLEKKQVAGGTFAFAGVSFAPNSHFATDAGKHVDLNDVIKSIQVYNHYIPSTLLLKNYLEEIPETVTWCESVGVEFMDMGGFFGDAPYGVEMPFSMALAYGAEGMSMGSEDGTLGGKTVIEAFVAEVEKRGLDIRYSTPAQELVVENGRVAGVLATDDSGKVIKFEAPAVLLCTGGWGSNPDFLRELGKVNPDRVISSGYDGRDGDGVYMARKAGAAWARGDGTIMFYGPHLPGATWGDNLYNGVYQPVLWVDQNGNRFMNEGGANQMEVGSAIRDIPRMFVLSNQSEIDRLTAEGGYQGNDNGAGGSGPLGEFKAMLEAQIAAGNERVHVAETLDELASATGAVNLKATVERYNQLCSAGADADFQKNASFMKALTEGPFYAFECDDGFYTTVGGMRINEDILAVDDNGDVIEGLYVAGCDTGALCGDIYDFTSAPGEQSSWALNSGRMVAKHVAEAQGK